MGQRCSWFDSSCGELPNYAGRFRQTRLRSFWKLLLCNIGQSSFLIRQSQWSFTNLNCETETLVHSGVRTVCVEPQNQATFRILDRPKIVSLIGSRNNIGFTGLTSHKSDNGFSYDPVVLSTILQLSQNDIIILSVTETKDTNNKGHKKRWTGYEYDTVVKKRLLYRTYESLYRFDTNGPFYVSVLIHYFSDIYNSNH